MKSEFTLIEILRARASRTAARSAGLIRGIGDDAAVFATSDGRESLISSDLLVEEIDFRLSYSPPDKLAKKVLSVSLSDIAAMGGRPRYSLLSLGIPRKHPSNDDEFWRLFMTSYFEVADSHNVALIGGDTSATPDHLIIDSVVLGECLAGKSIGRNTARPGDAVYVTGSVGAAAVGLRLLAGAPKAKKSDDLVLSAIEAQLAPVARVDFGALVGERGLAHAMIDVSDGLAQDVSHICVESGVTAVIDFDLVPVAREVRLVETDPSKAFEFAVSGGEDFELVLTADPSSELELNEIAVECGLALTRIGSIEMAKEAPIFLSKKGDSTPYRARGFDHFAV